MARARNFRVRQQESRLQQLEFGPNLPAFRAYQRDEQTTLPGNGADTQLLFDVWENCAPDVFEETVTGSPALLVSVTSRVTGVVFMISYVLKIATPSLVAPDNVALGIWEEEGGNPPFQDGPVVIHPASPLPNPNSSGMYSMTLVRGYPPIWMRGEPITCSNSPCFPTWEFYAAQDSGGDKDTVNGMFEIYLIGGLSCDASELG